MPFEKERAKERKSRAAGVMNAKVGRKTTADVPPPGGQTSPDGEAADLAATGYSGDTLAAPARWSRRRGPTRAKSARLWHIARESAWK